MSRGTCTAQEKGNTSCDYNEPCSSSERRSQAWYPRSCNSTLVNVSLAILLDPTNIVAPFVGWSTRTLPHVVKGGHTTV
jgi:hypothetical protein